MECITSTITLFMKLENTDYLDSKWINKKLWEYKKYSNLCSKDRQNYYRFGITWGKVNNCFVWTIPLRKEDQEWWLSKSDNSKVGLGSAMKNTDINGLHKIWTHNHTVVASQCKINRQETTETYFLIITYSNLKRMMLSYVSGFQHLQKTKKYSFSLSKKNDNMKLCSLLALNCLSLSSEEAEKIASSSHRGGRYDQNLLLPSHCQGVPKESR